MSNPFKGMQAALQVMTTEGQVLPATGQAVEDLMLPDQDEAYDRVRLGLKADDILEIVLETPNTSLYRDCKSMGREEKHLLRYFLDGSARTFYLGVVSEGPRQTPVHVAQIGAATVFRKDDGLMKVAEASHRKVLLINKDELSFGNKIESEIKKAGDDYQFVDLKETDSQTDGVQAGKEPRSRAAHKANWQMRRLEQAIAEGLNRKDGEWLVLDGGLGSEFAKDWPDGKEFIGVVKSSWKRLQFCVTQGRGKKILNTFQLLADLKVGQRTLAFSLRDGLIVTWYVRIRGPEFLDFPIMGVLRVELPNRSQQAVSSDLIDEISGALIAERSVSPHGKDIRWHSHLYAIYLAEQAVKNGFISTEALKAGLKWPSAK